MKHCTLSLTLVENRQCRLCLPSLGKPWVAALTRQYQSVWWASLTMMVHRLGSFKYYFTLVTVSNFLTHVGFVSAVTDTC